MVEEEEKENKKESQSCLSVGERSIGVVLSSRVLSGKTC